MVGPTGVFVVETKNRKGKIVGNFDEREWVQCKIGRGGTPYKNEFYSPVKQVSTHIYRLVGFLKENGLRTHVSGAVYFPSFETSLSLKGTPGDLPVFCASNGGKTALKNYILQKDATLSPEYVAKLCALLKNT